MSDAGLRGKAWRKKSQEARLWTLQRSAAPRHLASASPLCKGLSTFLFLPIPSCSPSCHPPLRFHFSTASMHEAHSKLGTWIDRWHESTCACQSSRCIWIRGWIPFFICSMCCYRYLIFFIDVVSSLQQQQETPPFISLIFLVLHITLTNSDCIAQLVENHVVFPFSPPPPQCGAWLPTTGGASTLRYGGPGWGVRRACNDSGQSTACHSARLPSHHQGPSQEAS